MLFLTYQLIYDWILLELQYYNKSRKKANSNFDS